jgi:hypothetical protein
VYSHSDFFGLRVPESSTGAFDLYSWQLLWMVGLTLGSRHAKSLSAAPSNGADSDSRMPGWLVKLSVMIAATLLVLRYAPANHWMNVQLYAWLIDKWHLGAVRLLDFAAIALLLVCFGHRIAGLPLFRPLASLGQASIQVFSVHVLFCVAGLALSKDANPELPWWEQGVLLSATVSVLFVTAHLANKRSRNNAWGSFWRPRHNSDGFQRCPQLQLDRA